MREEENKRDPLGKRRPQKRWVYPAVYLASAAIIIAAVLWFQSDTGQIDDPGQYSVNDGQPDTVVDIGEKDDTSYFDEESVPTATNTKEVVQMPVIEGTEVMVQRPFYTTDATEAEQEAALVFYQNTYRPNKGIDYALESGETFDVSATLSGTVVNVSKSPVLGNIVELEHEYGVTTYYQSLDDIRVQVGDRVKQGDILASAGRNLYNKDSGIHVHFELRQNGIPLNPVEYFEKPLSSFGEDKDVEEDKEEEGKEKEDEPSDTKEDTTSDDADASRGQVGA